MKQSDVINYLPESLDPVQIFSTKFSQLTGCALVEARRLFKEAFIGDGIFCQVDNEKLPSILAKGGVKSSKSVVEKLMDHYKSLLWQKSQKSKIDFPADEVLKILDVNIWESEVICVGSSLNLPLSQGKGFAINAENNQHFQWCLIIGFKLLCECVYAEARVPCRINFGKETKKEYKVLGEKILDGVRLKQEIRDSFAKLYQERKKIFAENLLARAKALIKMGDRQRAYRCAQGAYFHDKLNPSLDPDILQVYAELCLDNNAPSDAEFLSKQLFGLSPKINGVISAWASQAEAFFNKKNLAAIPYLDRVIEAQPKVSKYWMMRGVLKTIATDIEGALLDLVEAISLDEKNAQAWYECGRIKYSLIHQSQQGKGDYSPAYDDFSQAIRWLPDYKAAREGRATISILNHNYANAMQDVDVLIRLDPNNTSALLMRAQIRIGEEKYEDAIEDISRVMDLDEDNPVAWVLQGNALFCLDYFEEAINSFDYGIKLNYIDSQVFMMRADCKRKLGRFDEAIQDVEQSLRLNPNNEIAKVMLKDFNEMKEASEKNKIKTNADNAIPKNDDNNKDHNVVQVKPVEKPVADNNQGLALSDDIDEIINAASKLDAKTFKLRLSQLTIDREYWQSQGLTHYNNQKYADAIFCYSKVIDVDTNDYNSLQTRGAAKRVLKCCEGAIIDLEQAIKICPNNDWAIQELSHAKKWQASIIPAHWKNIAFEVSEVGQYEEALIYYNKIIAQDSRNIEAWASLVRCKGMLGRYSEAIQDANRALRMFSDKRDFWSLKALFKFLLGDHDGALQDCAQAASRKLLVHEYNYVFHMVVEALINLIRGNDLRAALKQCDDAYEIVWSDFFVCFAKGVAHKSLGDANKAKEYLNLAVAELKHLSGLNIGMTIRGVANLLSENYSAAYEDLKEALRLCPESDLSKRYLLELKKVLDAWKHQAYEHNANEQYTEVVVFAEKVLGVNKNDRSMQQLAKEAKSIMYLKEKISMLYSEKKFSEAISACDRVIAKGVKGSYFIQIRGQSKLNSNQFEEAIADFMEVVRLTPNNTYAVECLKEARRKLKEQNMAKAPVLNMPTLQDSPVFSHAINFSMVIRKDQLHLEQQPLGEGSFGVVYRGSWQPTSMYNVSVAVKQLKNSSMSTKVLSDFKREVEVQAKLDSIGVVKLYGITAEQPYCMVMEFMEKGSLRDVLDAQAREQLHWDIRLQMAANIAVGLDYLHHHDPVIIHGDLKSLNILVNGEGVAKLADFGLATLKTETRSKEYVTQDAKQKGPKGSLLWLAPELFRMNAKRTPASDIFSFGVVLWEMASHLFPYESAQGSEGLIREWVTSGDREQFDERTPNTPQAYVQITQRCWDGDVSKRPSAREVAAELTKLFSNTSLAAKKHSSESQMNAKSESRVGSGGYLVQSVATKTQSSATSPKVSPKNSRLADNPYLAQSISPSTPVSSSSSVQESRKSQKADVYMANVYK